MLDVYTLQWLFYRQLLLLMMMLLLPLLLLLLLLFPQPLLVHGGVRGAILRRLFVSLKP